MILRWFMLTISIFILFLLNCSATASLIKKKGDVIVTKYFQKYGESNERHECNNPRANPSAR